MKNGAALRAKRSVIPAMMDSEFWKVSVYDEDMGAFLVKNVCIRSEYEAISTADSYAERGLLARASRHINKDKEYIYGKRC